MRRLVLLLSLSLTCALSPAAVDTDQPFVTVQLAHGASVSIPKSWEINRGRELPFLPDETAAIADQYGYPKLFEKVDRLIVASSPDPEHSACVAIIALNAPAMTPSWPASLSDEKLKAMDASVKKNIETVRAMLGEKVSGWSPLKKIVIGRHVALHISFTLSSATEEQKVHRLRLTGNGRLYDINLSTGPADESDHLAVLEKIAESFAAD